MAAATRKPPTGVSRFVFRMPIYLYKARLGWLLRGRFMLLHHVGRKSGLPREAVVEVVRHDAASGDYYICSGFGEKAQWYQNLMAEPNIGIQVGTQEMDVRAARITPDDGSTEMLDYAARHPGAAKKLAGFMGFPEDGSEAAYQEAGRVLPFLRLTRLSQ
jgi:deazaflavin-dependent oxidoreductase (nitroreductase family)